MSARHTIVHQFWYSLDNSTTLRKLNLYSANSILKQGHHVWFHCYQPFTNLPKHKNFKILDCNKLLPHDQLAVYLQSNTCIAHISDLIRTLILYKYGGWWLDCDTIILRCLPRTEKYYFATMPKKRSGGGFYHYEQSPAFWKDSKNFKFLDGKDDFQNSPIFIRDKNDLFIEKLRDFTVAKITKRMKWRDSINYMRSLIIEMKLQDHVYPPIWFCPIGHWLRDLPIKNSFADTQVKYSANIASASDILSNTFTVQFFFMSSQLSKTSSRNDEWLQEMRQKFPGSLFNQIILALELDSVHK